MYNLLTPVKDCQQCISIDPELKRESGNYSESKALAVTLADVILNGSSNIKDP